MKRFFPVCALLLAFVCVAAFMLTSCTQEREFKKVDVVTTEPPVTEGETVNYSELTVFNTRMGMSLEETQKALDTDIEIRFSQTNQVYFAISKNALKEELDFGDSEFDAAIYFIYDGDARLCEVQYVSTDSTGFVLKDATEKFDSLYGRHVAVSSEGKTNYVWYSKGDYIVISDFDNGQNAISYFERVYFENTQPEEATAYLNAEKAD